MDLVNNIKVDYFVAEKPLESVNGDTVFVDVKQEEMFLGIVDGAGHGPEAHSIAQTCHAFFEENKSTELPALMQALHEKLRGTRGGVAIVGKLDFEQLQLRYVGVGNIALRKFGNVMKRMITQEGVIGYHIRTPQERMLQLSPGDVVVMHTDGITSQFDIGDYPQILKDDAKTIANKLLEKFSKNDDDATCLVVRFK